MNKPPYRSLPPHQRREAIAQSDPATAQAPPKQPFNWKMAGMASVSLIALSIPVIWQAQQPSILHINAIDISDSAKNHQPELAKQVCQTGSEYRQSGDRLVTIFFAHRAEIVSTQDINGQLDSLAACQRSLEFKSSDTTKYPGTDFMAPLAESLLVIKQPQNRSRPVVITMTLHQAEAGPGIAKLDWDKARQLVRQITSDRGILVIIGPTGELQTQLMQHLAELPHVLICPAQGGTDCVRQAFSQGRYL
ncbi:hypothetical protein [Merismopedia glauca]|uniref:VWFA domain-containing protein n=1 Tax=Merismopedia glauca CCAP 1448/3 TaxID=1296344 RepID=A0A2T1BY67_9CYAN|nr:hypothetical protein [Merismopedia glauca]PSB00867.1 hypothetical protein C7B64_21240 [Merismopedia glauca CCAP 1448/3]